MHSQTPYAQPDRHPCSAGLRRLAARLAAGVPLLLALLMSGGAPSQAQTFFAESDALREGSAIELTLSGLTERSRTDTGGVAAYEDIDSSVYRLDGRLRAGVLALGAMGEARRFSEDRPAALQNDDSDQAAGYGALVLESLLADEDALFLVLSTARRSDTFEYDAALDGVGPYRRELDSDVGLQAGLVYRIGFLIGGYIQGSEELRLRVSDPTPTAIDEVYPFDYTAWLAGLIFGDPEDVGLLLLMQRKDTPAVPGTAVDLEEGMEELQRLALGLGRVRLDVQQTHVRQSFTGESLREVTERDASLGLHLAERFTIALSQKRTEDRQEFTLFGTPIADVTETTEYLLRLIWRF